jgi:hypothetical protein
MRYKGKEKEDLTQNGRIKEQLRMGKRRENLGLLRIGCSADVKYL